MTRFTAWIVRNVDALIAVVLAVAIALLGLLDVGNLGDPDHIDQAILLILAVLATALLRDRSQAESSEEELRNLVTRTEPVITQIQAELARLQEVQSVVERTRQKLDDISMVRVLYGLEIGHAHAEARRDTDRWIFKGGTGTYLRAVTLPQCVQTARREKRTLLVRVEIIDPSSEEVCAAYARFRNSLSTLPDGTGETWTTERARKESFATVLAACWYRQRFGLLDIDLGLSGTITTFRWDVSSSAIIITQEDPAAPAMLIERGKFFYDRYSTELLTSLEQARRVPIESARLVPLSDEPTVEEVQKLFVKLGLPLPSTFSDRAVADVIRRALRAKNPYEQ